MLWILNIFSWIGTASSVSKFIPNVSKLIRMPTGITTYIILGLLIISGILGYITYSNFKSLVIYKNEISTYEQTIKEKTNQIEFVQNLNIDLNNTIRKNELNSSALRKKANKFSAMLKDLKNDKNNCLDATHPANLGVWFNNNNNKD